MVDEMAIITNDGRSCLGSCLVRPLTVCPTHSTLFLREMAGNGRFTRSKPILSNSEIH